MNNENRNEGSAQVVSNFMESKPPKRKNPVGIIIGIVLILIGVGTCYSYFFNYKTYSKTDELSIKGVKQINLNTSAKINIVPTNNEQISVDITGRASYKPNYNVTNNDGVLTINFNNEVHVGIAFSNLEMNIELPTKYNDDINVKNTSGKINFAVTKLKDVNISCTSGQIALENLKCRSLFVKATSGSINTQLIEVSDQCDIRDTSGSINVASLKAKTATVKSTSGKIVINSLEAKTANVNCTSGSTTINDIIDTDLMGDNTSGSMNITYTEFDNNIDLSCSSGTINLSLPKESKFKLNASTSSGKVKVDDGFNMSYSTEKSSKVVGETDSNAKNEIKLQASSGGINVQ